MAPHALQQIKSGPKPKKVGNHCHRALQCALISGLLRKLFVSVVKQSMPMETMTDEADRRLLRAVVTCNNHVLMLFPPIQATQYNLRPRAHNFKLPEKDNINFISRILFKR